MNAPLPSFHRERRGEKRRRREGEKEKEKKSSGFPMKFTRQSVMSCHKEGKEHIMLDGLEEGERES